MNEVQHVVLPGVGRLGLTLPDCARILRKPRLVKDPGEKDSL